MNTTVPFRISLLLVVVALVFVGINFYRSRCGRGTANYRVLFAMGVFWLLAGSAGRNLPFGVLGTAFFFTGLLNREKLEQEKKWSDLAPNERRFNLFLISSLMLLLISGLFTFLLADA